MPPPEDKKGVERLSGFLNYVAKFIPDLSSITQPIRELIKEGMPVQLEPRTRNSFQKNDISTGAVLLQENKPIAYPSRALTDTEKRYAQIEKQLLAVVYALEKFNQYVYGKTVQVESDHKPLESITKKSLCQVPPSLYKGCSFGCRTEEYKRFTKEWGIQHVTTRPYHPQANGLAEKSIQIIQSLLNKSKANNQDPYLSLLEYCSTTVVNVGSSAQLLMGRKLRATLPVTASQLKPRIIPSEVVQRTQVKSAPLKSGIMIKEQNPCQNWRKVMRHTCK
ncbi:hypothetical protein EMCRGX_G012702 [Ephydatia muelleri]